MTWSRALHIAETRSRQREETSHGVCGIDLHKERKPTQASLEQGQRFQQVFFPDGIAFDGNGFVGTGVTAPAFSYLRTIEDRNERMVDQTGIEPVTS